MEAELDLVRQVRERALFAAQLHLRQGTLLTDEAIRDVCLALVAGDFAPESREAARQGFCGVSGHAWLTSPELGLGYCVRCGRGLR